MLITKFLSATTITIAILASTSIANAAGCSLDGVTLNCTANGKSAKDIMQTFASEDTRKALGAPLSEKPRFEKNGSLEKYRRSMERNWRTITRHARQQQRNRNRGRISEIKFQAFSKKFHEAEKSYGVALNFYRQLHWQGFQ